MSFDYLQRGTTFTRLAIIKALAGENPIDAPRIAAERYGRDSAVFRALKGLNHRLIVEKAGVSGGGTGSGEWGAELADFDNAQAEHIEAASRLGAFGPMLTQGTFRRAPAMVPFVATSTGATAYWTAQGRPTPVSRMAFDRIRMRPLTLTALVVVPNELLEDASPEAEAIIRGDLERAEADLVDRAWADETNAGAEGEQPAGIGYGKIHLASTGDLADDIEMAFGAYSGDLRTACWMMSPRLSASIGLRAGGRGIAADLGALGGTLCGLPVFCTEACQLDSDGSGSITLLDAAGVAVVDEGAAVTRSSVATIEMDDSPTADALAPTAGTATPVSMFTTESTAIKLVRTINWRAARQSSVVVIQNANYVLMS